MHLFKKIVATSFIITFISIRTFSQQDRTTILDSGHKTSLRGLSIVDDNTLWASGSNGTVARSTDGGKTFQWLTVKGYEKRDFRDVEAFDSNTALIMAVAEPALVLRTSDGGQNWEVVFSDTTKGMFLDAMDFDQKGADGFMIGDPIMGQPFEALTVNRGQHWVTMEYVFETHNLKDGEAFFAASGTNIRVTRNKDFPVMYVTGGTQSRLFYRDSFYALSIIQGKQSAGANSIALDNSERNGVIVGGDFANDTSTKDNCVLVKFPKEGGPLFSEPQAPPNGYRSCVAYITENKLITCGTAGVDISHDGGLNWQLISTQSFHVCQKAKKGSAVFLAGANGKIAKLVRN